jgi:hypothetical protein
MDLKLRIIKMGSENSILRDGHHNAFWATNYRGLRSREVRKSAWLSNYNDEVEEARLNPTICILITKTYISRQVLARRTISISIIRYPHFNFKPSAFRLRAIRISIYVENRYSLYSCDPATSEKNVKKYLNFNVKKKGQKPPPGTVHKSYL